MYFNITNTYLILVIWKFFISIFFSPFDTGICSLGISFKYDTDFDEYYIELGLIIFNICIGFAKHVRITTEEGDGD